MFKNIFHKYAIRGLVVVTLVAALSYSPMPLGACPPFERYEEYFSYCPDGDLIGTIDRTCGCSTITTGTTNGLYRIDHFLTCDTQDEYLTIYYGRCNTGAAWTQLSGPEACNNPC
jgi:hypothetical protein